MHHAIYIWGLDCWMRQFHVGFNKVQLMDEMTSSRQGKRGPSATVKVIKTRTPLYHNKNTLFIYIIYFRFTLRFITKSLKTVDLLWNRKWLSEIYQFFLQSQRIFRQIIPIHLSARYLRNYSRRLLVNITQSIKMLHLVHIKSPERNVHIFRLTLFVNSVGRYIQRSHICLLPHP